MNSTCMTSVDARLLATYWWQITLVSRALPPRLHLAAGHKKDCGLFDRQQDYKSVTITQGDPALVVHWCTSRIICNSRRVCFKCDTCVTIDMQDTHWSHGTPSDDAHMTLSIHVWYCAEMVNHMVEGIHYLAKKEIGANENIDGKTIFR